jgi:hypothetical protein
MSSGPGARSFSRALRLYARSRVKSKPNVCRGAMNANTDLFAEPHLFLGFVSTHTHPFA